MDDQPPRKNAGEISESNRILLEDLHAKAALVAEIYAESRPGIPIIIPTQPPLFTVNHEKSQDQRVVWKTTAIRDDPQPSDKDEIDRLSQRVHQLGVNDYVEVKIENTYGRLASGKKPRLLVLDLNGIFTYRIYDKKKEIDSSGAIRMGNFIVWVRPHIEEFLSFVFSNFEVGVWSSVTKANLEPMVKLVFGKFYQQLLFIADQSFCQELTSKDPNYTKPIFLKNLDDLWHEYPIFNRYNTLIIDDSNEKMINNPPKCHFNPGTWKGQMNDNALSSKGKIYFVVQNFILDSSITLRGLSLTSNQLQFEKVTPAEPPERVDSPLRELLETGSPEGHVDENE